MGDVIPFKQPVRPLELARDLLQGMANLTELIIPDDAESMLIRDTVAERVAEAHDILRDYLKTQSEGG